ncbi:MAG TPA: hypothetical protein VF944_03350 [Candidatus Bathyarchaeia archaeon]
MIIRFEQSLTVAGFLAEVKRHYGSEEELRRYSKRKPKDILAAEDLEDFEYYSKHPEMQFEKIRRAVSVIPVNEQALSIFSPERLRLLDVLSSKQFESIRQLAGFLKRDVHNVHEDLKRFQALRVLELERGPGNSRIPRLLAQYITILPTHWEKLEAFKEG